MATLVVRDVPDEVARALSHRAVDVGRSREAFIRDILQAQAGGITMLRKEQLSSSRTIAQSIPGQGTAYVSHILIAQEVQRIELYDATGLENPGMHPVWRRDNAQAGDIYVINCPFTSGIAVKIEGSNGLATILWDMAR